ncbi:hypothetical protein [Aeromonas enteropelogenes]|uniref:hypothetical protein n=1 Tax=Aeromonas enteropelogenes TaxID=29489 RepID=UPI003B9EAE95
MKLQRNKHVERLFAGVAGEALREKVTNAIRNRVAFLFVREDDGFVLQPMLEGGVPGVLVVAAWGSAGAPGRHMQEVRALARMIGGRWLRFHSARRGWLKTAGAMGWVRQPDDADGLYVFQMTL